METLVLIASFSLQKIILFQTAQIFDKQTFHKTDLSHLNTKITNKTKLIFVRFLLFIKQD